MSAMIAFALVPLADQRATSRICRRTSSMFFGTSNSATGMPTRLSIATAVRAV